MQPNTPAEPTIKDQLIKFISSGLSKKLLGKEMKVENLDKLNNEELNKMYAIYKSILTSAMTKSLGDAIRLYSHIAYPVLALQDTEKKLADDLSGDSFLNYAVRNLSCNLYYRFGSWLSPLSVGIITGKHYLDNKPKETEKPETTTEENNPTNSDESI